MNRGILQSALFMVAASASASAATITIGGSPLPLPTGILGGLSTDETGSGLVLVTFDDKLGKVSRFGRSGIANKSRSGVRLMPSANESRFVTFAMTGPGGFRFQKKKKVYTDYVSYVGFYWGSIDAYNTITFTTVLGDPISIQTAGGQDLGQTLGGLDVAQLAGLSASDLLETSTIPSLYVNFYFPDTERPYQLTVNTVYPAFEIDNVAYKIDPLPVDPASPPGNIVVPRSGPSGLNAGGSSASGSLISTPAPGAFALLGLGALGLIHRARRACARS